MGLWESPRPRAQMEYFLWFQHKKYSIGWPLSVKMCMLRKIRKLVCEPRTRKRGTSQP